MVNKFSIEEDNYIKENINTQNYKQIAENLNKMFGSERTEKTVAQHCYRALKIQREVFVFSPEEDDYIREHINEQSHKELAENLNRLFGKSWTGQSVNKHCYRVGIFKDNINYTEEQIEFVRENAPHMSLNELENAYNKKFKYKRSAQALYDLSRKLGVHRTRETISRIYDETGKNHAADEGSINIKEGRARIKVNGKWRLRSRVVWEQNNGDIPKGFVIIHLNGDGEDDGLENLACVPRRYCGLIARTFNGLGEDVEINRTKLMYCELKDALCGR